MNLFSRRSYFRLASLNDLMNLFSRRSYFLLADPPPARTKVLQKLSEGGGVYSGLSTRRDRRSGEAQAPEGGWVRLISSAQNAGLAE